jgi:GAF domain-containing protein
VSVPDRIDSGLHWIERIRNLVITIVFLVGAIVAAVVWLRNRHVAAWVPVLVAIVLLSAFVVLAYLYESRRRPTSTSGQPRIQELEQRLADADRTIGQSEYEKRLLTEALESIQQAIGNEEDTWDLDALVQRGVLGPARGLLVRAREEDVRLAVLVPADSPPTQWRMRWAEGHRPESVTNYQHEIDKTLAGIAFRRGDYVERGDVRADDDFTPNPKETRPFRSLVAVPLRVDQRIVGVLSVVSNLPHAFDEADVSFVKALGAVIDVVMAVERDSEIWEGIVRNVELVDSDDEKDDDE